MSCLHRVAAIKQTTENRDVLPSRRRERDFPAIFHLRKQSDDAERNPAYTKENAAVIEEENYIDFFIFAVSGWFSKMYLIIADLFSKGGKHVDVICDLFQLDTATHRHRQ